LIPEIERIEEVQVSVLRADIRARLSAGKPLIVRKNSSALAVVLCVVSHRWGIAEHPRRQKKRLRTELESILKQLRM
jgi:hypothetical protein